MDLQQKNAGLRVQPATVDTEKSRGQPSSPTASVANLAGAAVDATGEDSVDRMDVDDRVPPCPGGGGIAAAGDNIKAQLQRIFRALQDMEAKTKVQRNISTVITRGMAVIREAADAAKSECDRLTPLMTVLTKPVVQATKTATGTDTPASKRKRETTGNSPDLPPRKVTPSEEVDGGSFAEVVRRKSRRKKKQAADTDGQQARAATNTNKGAAKQQQPNGPKATVRTETRAKGGPSSETLGRKFGTGVVLVRPSQGKTYADTLRKIKTSVNPETDDVRIQGYRKTKDGSLLLRMTSRADKRRDFQDKLKSALGGEGQVRDLTSTTRLEILDLDCVTTVEDVTNALRKETGQGQCWDPKVFVFEPNKYDVSMAVCEVEDSVAQTLLRKGRLKIGWVNCRVRTRADPLRCFRCQGYGHRRVDCKGPDRSGCCRRCGETGHIRQTCKAAQPKCFLCSEARPEQTNHVPGSGACGMFRAALEECRKKTRQ